MARPPKDSADRKTADLRIPMTAAQKQTVMDAMAIDGREMAGWARGLILAEAAKLLPAQSGDRNISVKPGKKST